MSNVHVPNECVMCMFPMNEQCACFPMNEQCGCLQGMSNVHVCNNDHIQTSLSNKRENVNTISSE